MEKIVLMIVFLAINHPDLIKDYIKNIEVRINYVGGECEKFNKLENGFISTCTDLFYTYPGDINEKKN